MKIRVTGTIECNAISEESTLKEIEDISKTSDILSDMKDSVIAIWNENNQPYDFDEQREEIRDDIEDNLKLSGIKVAPYEYEKNSYYEKHIEGIIDGLVDKIYDKISDKVKSGDFTFTENETPLSLEEVDDEIYDFYIDTDIEITDITKNYMSNYLKLNKDELIKISDNAIYYDKPIDFVPLASEVSKNFYGETEVDIDTSAFIYNVMAGKTSLQEGDTISTTVKFADGKEMDVKLCGADENQWFTEAVLFDENGSELCCTEPCDDYFGEWEFEYDGNLYIGNIVEREREIEPPSRELTYNDYEEDEFEL